jgi:hypothetical protein
MSLPLRPLDLQDRLDEWRRAKGDERRDLAEELLIECDLQDAFGRLVDLAILCDAQERELIAPLTSKGE